MSAFSVAFFLQSVFGFGGVIIAFAMLGVFIDIKSLIFMGFILAFFSKFTIIFTDFRSFSLKKLIQLIIPLTPGLFIGAHILSIFSPKTLLIIFALFLIIYSLYSIFVKEIKIPKTIQWLILFLGGIIQGMFGTGGPFAVVAKKNDFKNKSELRSTLAVLFIVSDLIRGVQYYAQKTFDYAEILNFWWMIIAVTLAVIIGFYVHIKINEKTFKMGLNSLLLLAGILLLFK